jgi:hypothetical protein
LSNNPINEPETKGLPGWNNFNISDRYYGEIISQHSLLGGQDSAYHTKSITYVKKEDHDLFCELVSRKLHENYISNVTVCFKRAEEKGFIFKKHLGYEFLCLEDYN